MKKIAPYVAVAMFIAAGAICLVLGYEHKNVRWMMYPAGALHGVIGGAIWPRRKKATH